MIKDKEPQGFWRVRYTVLSILLAGWLFSFLDRMVMGVALPYIGDDFGLNNEQKGLIMSAFFVGYALFQIPGGMLADKFGPRKVMSFAIGWWSVFTSLTGMVFTLPLMLVTRLVFGLGEAAFPAGSWKTIALYFPSKQRATATAIQASVNALGPALATVAAAGIIHMFGWRVVFIGLGLPGLVIALVMYVYLRNDPTAHPRMSALELKELADDPGVTSLNTETGRQVSFGDLMKQKILWQLVAIWFFFDITYWGFVSWLPSYLIKGRGFSLEQLAGYGSLPFFVGTVSLIMGGVLSDKLKARGLHRKWLFIPACAVAAAAAVRHLRRAEPWRHHPCPVRRLVLHVPGIRRLLGPGGRRHPARHHGLRLCDRELRRPGGRHRRRLGDRQAGRPAGRFLRVGLLVPHRRIRRGSAGRPDHQGHHQTDNPLRKGPEAGHCLKSFSPNEARQGIPVWLFLLRFLG